MNLRQVIDSNPNHWIALNDLAWLLYEESSLAEAVMHAERAHELAPNHPAVNDTLGVIRLAQGDYEDALRLLRRAFDRLRTRQVGLHLAQAQARNELTVEARDTLQQILAAEGPFEERQEAEALLRELGG